MRVGHNSPRGLIIIPLHATLCTTILSTVLLLKHMNHQYCAMSIQNEQMHGSGGENTRPAVMIMTGGTE